MSIERVSTVVGATSHSTRQRRLLWTARWAIGLVPLVWLIWRAEPLRVLQSVADIHFAWWLAALAATGLSLLAGSARWLVLLRACGGPRAPSLGALFAHNLVGVYFSLLPGGVAGDAVRGYRVRRHVLDLATSYAVVVFEKLAALLGLIIVAVAGATARPWPVSGPALGALECVLGVGAIAALAGLVAPSLMAKHPGWRDRVMHLPVVGRVLLRLCPAAKPVPLLGAVALSAMASGFAVLGLVCLCRPIASGTSLAAISSVVPLAILLTYVPVTPAAIGQREAVLVYTLGLVGVPAPVSLGVSVLTLGVAMTYAAAGAVCYFAGPYRSRTLDDAQP